jgi:hypothetical protein
MELKSVNTNMVFPAVRATGENKPSKPKLADSENEYQFPDEEILEPEVIETPPVSSKKENPKAFIEANTEAVTLKHLKDDCIIPVFRDNEKTVSHFEFIDSVNFVVNQCFKNETILEPDIRVSHKINGRIPSALNKKVSELEEWEKTKYYERIMFQIEVPSIADTIQGNELSLTIGGVRALNHESLFSKKSIEKFKVFIGFQNKVCTNLLVSTDGILLEIRVSGLQELVKTVFDLIGNYNMRVQLDTMREFGKYALTEHQFAQMIGKARLYQYLPAAQKKEISALSFNDSQFNAVARDYYTDKSFCRDAKGDINLWKLYGLFTGANKSSYIDTFLDRSVSAYTFTESLLQALEHESKMSWFLS